MEILELLTKTLGTAATDKLMERYALLRAVSVFAPVGRRSLATLLLKTEREARSDVEELERSGLLNAARSGLYLSDVGRTAMEELYVLLGGTGEGILPARETKLSVAERGVLAMNAALDEVKDGELLLDGSDAAYYGARSVVRGSVSVYPLGTVEHKGNKALGEMVSRCNRGGEGLAFKMPLSPKNMAKFVSDQAVTQYSSRLNGASCAVGCVMGAGEAAKRYEFSHRLVNILVDEGAVAEMFGYFLREDGRIVYTYSPVAPAPEALGNMKLFLVGYGKKKDKIEAAVRSRFANARIFF